MYSDNFLNTVKCCCDFYFVLPLCLVFFRRASFFKKVFKCFFLRELIFSKFEAVMDQLYHMRSVRAEVEEHVKLEEQRRQTTSAGTCVFKI